MKELTEKAQSQERLDKEKSDDIINTVTMDALDVIPPRKNVHLTKRLF